MPSLSPHKTGLALGAFLGGWHAVWALLVALGWAQPLIDFIFWIHFIKPIYLIAPFNIGLAVLLVGVTAVIGYVTGYVFGIIWNRLHP